MEDTLGYCLNRVSIIGNVGREVELRQTAHGQSVCNISVGTDKKWKDKKSGDTKGRTSWHKVTAWDSLADMCAKTILKGSKVYIDGELLYEDYTAKDGSPRQKAFIKADQVIVLPKGESYGQRRDQEGRSSLPLAQPASPVSERAWDEGPDADSDIPF